MHCTLKDMENTCICMIREYNWWCGWYMHMIDYMNCSASFGAIRKRYCAMRWPSARLNDRLTKQNANRLRKLEYLNRIEAAPRHRIWRTRRICSANSGGAARIGAAGVRRKRVWVQYCIWEWETKWNELIQYTTVQYTPVEVWRDDGIGNTRSDTRNTGNALCCNRVESRVESWSDCRTEQSTNVMRCDAMRESDVTWHDAIETNATERRILLDALHFGNIYKFV